MNPKAVKIINKENSSINSYPTMTNENVNKILWSDLSQYISLKYSLFEIF